MYDEKILNLLDELNIKYESGDMDYDTYSDVYDKICTVYEGKIVNNIPRSEAKKAGNYGKDKLTPEEDDKHYKKRLYRATSGSPLTLINRKLDEKFAPTEDDAEKARKRGGEGRKFKLTGKDAKKIINSKGKDLGKALYKGAARDTLYDVTKQQATTFGSLPGQAIGAAVGGAVAGPVGASVGGTAGQFTGASLGSLNQNLGTASKLTKVLSDYLKKIDNSDLSENDKKVLKTKARIVSQRYFKQHSNSKHIDDKYMIDLSKELNRELYGKTSSFKDVKNMVNEIKDKAKENDSVKKGAKKVITREIPDKEGIKELGTSVGRLATSIPSAAYHGSSIAVKKAAKSVNDKIASKSGKSVQTEPGYEY